jgi:hypothetical protein
MRDDEVYPPEAVERFRRVEAEALESATPVTVEESFGRGPDAATYFTQVFALHDGDGRPNAIAGTGIDISDRIRADEERRRLEARAQEARRLETVGRLAGGVAHDFNNLLSVILNNAALAAEDLPEGSTARADLEEIRAAAERAAGLTHQLVLFSRQEMPEPEVLDPNEIVRGAERLLDRVLGEGAELHRGWRRRAPISVDPGQLERVLLHLAVNARDAMPRGGRVDIVTGRTVVGGEPWARLAVCDRGPGMSEEVAARAFEPFFTTKTGGEGVGLGLPRATGSSGRPGRNRARLASPFGGTDVVMRFPAADPAPAPPQDSSEQREWPGSAGARGGGRGRGAQARRAPAPRRGLRGRRGRGSDGRARRARCRRRVHRSAADRRGDAGEVGPRARGAAHRRSAGVAGPVHVGLHR